MKMSRRPFLLMGSAMLLGTAMASTQDAWPFLGDWFATLDAGSVKLRLRMQVSDGPRATLFSIDQGNTPIPASSVRIDGTHIRVEWQVIGAVFEGTLDNAALAGTFTQGKAFPLAFTRTPATSAAITPLTQAGLAALRAKAGSPAMIAAARSAKGQQVAFVDGVRILGQAQRATLDDRWHIGSCTKSVTATLVARLVEAGQLSWDDKVGSALGAAIPGMNADLRDITFLHLLSHRSGMAGNIPVAELSAFPRENPDPRSDRLRYARIALSARPSGRREQHFEYSNSGYVVAGAMIEQKLGRPWEDLVREYVLEPLGMQGAGFGAPGTPGKGDQPAGHNLGETGALSPFPPGAPVTDNPAVIGPAGRLHATARDMLAYLQAHATRSSFLRPESWQRLHTPPFGGDYALGWIVKGDRLWHNGSNTLWYAEMSAERTGATVAFAATNDGRLGNVEEPVSQALRGAARAVA